MTRIFLGLACLDALFLVATTALGFLSDGRASVQIDQQLTTAQVYFTYHLLVGLTTAIVTLAVHSMAFTYFMGTGRWVDEVAEAYPVPEQIRAQCKALKKQTFRFAVASMVVTIVTAVCGAGTDTGQITSQVHLTTAVIMLVVNFASFFFEYDAIFRNNILLEQIKDLVDEIRAAHGLE